MNIELLRKGCELAGMPTIYVGGAWHAVESGKLMLKVTSPEHLEWIKSRCASLLVAKVREMGDDGHWMLAQHIGMMATDEQRIVAAITVLEDKQP